MKMENLKMNHSKVKNIEHNRIVMQKYLQPNSVKMSKEEAQLIFKMRYKMSNDKCNYKRIYEYLRCRACNMEDENQKHIVECQVLNSSKEKIEYEKIETGTVLEKLKIARIFKKNMEILEQGNS